MDNKRKLIRLGGYILLAIPFATLYYAGVMVANGSWDFSDVESYKWMGAIIQCTALSWFALFLIIINSIKVNRLSKELSDIKGE